MNEKERLEAERLAEEAEEERRFRERYDPDYQEAKKKKATKGSYHRQSGQTDKKKAGGSIVSDPETKSEGEESNHEE